MAQLKNQLLGQIHGGIGELVIKYRNGKPYLASKPSGYKSGNDSATIYKQNQCRFIGRLSKQIYKNDIIKKIWCQIDINSQYIYQHIWKMNFLHFRHNDLSGKITFVPSFGFPMHNQHILLNELKSGNIKTDPLGTIVNINPEIEKRITAFGIIVFNNNPQNSGSETYFGIITASPQTFDLTNPLDINFNINLNGIPQMTDNAVIKIFAALITLDESNSPVHYSEIITV